MFRRVFIQQDLTVKQREKRRELVQQLKHRKAQGETNLIIVRDKIVVKRQTPTGTATVSSSLKCFYTNANSIIVAFRPDRDRPLVTPQRSRVPAVVRGRGAVGTGVIFRDGPIGRPTYRMRYGLTVGRYFDSFDGRIAVVGISTLLGSAPANSSAVLRLRSWGRSAVCRIGCGTGSLAVSPVPAYIYPDYFPF